VEDLQQQLIAKEAVEESLREEVEALRRLTVAEAGAAGSKGRPSRNGVLTPELQQYVDAQASSQIAVARVEVAGLQAQLSQANSALQSLQASNRSYQQSLQLAEENINQLSEESTEKSDEIRTLKSELQKMIPHTEVTQLRTDLEVTRAQLKRYCIYVVYRQ
jgi:vacuolar-type H+-ATPase subunit I/STV1